MTNNNCTLKDLGGFTRLAPSTVSWYMNGLIKKELVRKINLGNKTIYRIKNNKEKIMEVLITYKKSFVDTLIDKTIEMWELP